MQRLASGLDRIRPGMTRLVGWGTGKTLDALIGGFPHRLEYLVEAVDHTLWGRHRHGLAVAGPGRLASEPPDHVVVVVFSNYYDDCCRQIAALGPFTVIPAIDASTASRIGEITRAAAAAQPRLSGAQHDHAILIQGPLVAGVTEQAVKAYCGLYPKALLILSTWQTADPQLLATLGPYVDLCLTSAPPDTPGRRNRNMQLVSTLRGLEAVRDAGVGHVLKTRTDVALLAEDLPERLAALQRQTRRPACDRYGLAGPIVVGQTFTRTYVPYFPSDIVMFGHTADLLRYWSRSPDGPEDAASDFGDVRLLSLRRFGLDGASPESWFCLDFLRRIGWPVEGTLRDGWRALSELFVVVDDAWLGMLWAKMPSLAYRPSVALETFSHERWKLLRDGDETALGALERRVDIDSVRIGDA